MRVDFVFYFDLLLLSLFDCCVGFCLDDDDCFPFLHSLALFVSAFPAAGFFSRAMCFCSLCSCEFLLGECLSFSGG